MNLLTRLANLLYKRQKILELLTVFLFFSIVVFRFDKNKIKLVWSDYPFIALILVLLTLIVALIWLKIEKIKTQQTINKIKNSSLNASDSQKIKLNELSSRQREVFDLIAEGKSNKEIIALLNIELSTLKTHVNKIYKILEIKNRKEALLLGKKLLKDK